MKKLTFLAILAFVPMILTAQYRGKGTIDIQAGIGFGTTLTGGGTPISISADYGWDDDKQIGGYFGFASTSTGFWDYTHTIIGVRGVYHKEFFEGINTYGGAMLGYNIVSAEWTGPGNFESDLSGITYTGFVGARHSFTDKLGVYGEVGFGVAMLNIGVLYKFK